MCLVGGIGVGSISFLWTGSLEQCGCERNIRVTSVDPHFLFFTRTSLNVRDS